MKRRRSQEIAQGAEDTEGEFRADPAGESPQLSARPLWLRFATPHVPSRRCEVWLRAIGPWTSHGDCGSGV
ncbi:MAG: hypothetical protein ACK56F_20090 [bacterium]